MTHCLLEYQARPSPFKMFFIMYLKGLKLFNDMLRKSSRSRCFPTSILWSRAALLTPEMMKKASSFAVFPNDDLN